MRRVEGTLVALTSGIRRPETNRSMLSQSASPETHAATRSPTMNSQERPHYPQTTLAVRL